jgi:SAM-dependent methyltransferase
VHLGRDLRQVNTMMWSSGDYAQVASLLRPGAVDLVERLPVGAGTRHLDVATGNGNVALLAAARGARVVGLDLTDAFFPQAMMRADAERTHIVLVRGDAEELPFPDGSFDLVTSTYGIQFAPRHARAATEIARVCAPAGMIGLCNWTPRSWTAHFQEIISSYFPPPPSFAGPPMRWGDEAYLGRLLGSLFDLRCERRELWYPFPTGAELVTCFENCFGPLITAKRTIAPRSRWDELRAELVEMTEGFVRADRRGTGIAIEYLLVLGHRRDPQ